MKFDNICEEEKYFPYMDISLEESREFRYLMSNVEVLKNGKILMMSLRNMPEYVYANGLLADAESNKTFEGFIYKKAHGYKIYTLVTDALSQRDCYSIDEFLYQIKNIRVNSRVERMEPVSKKINYPDESFARK